MRRCKARRVILAGTLLLLPVMGLFFAMPTAYAQGETISEIRVRGNAKVESDAVIALLKTQIGKQIDPATIRTDIRTLYELGYFSDISIFQRPVGDGIRLIIEVKEKPAITELAYEGFEEVTEEDLADKVKTKLYTIVNESDLVSDLRVIEKEYADRGYYLAKAHYTLESEAANEVKVTFHIDEGGEVKVGEVHILGNEYFSDAELISELASRPYTRASAYSSSASPGSSLFKEDYLKRDLEYLAYIYRDDGFADVKIAKPLTFLDSDREFVRITFQLEEGIQYNVGSIDVSGDLLFPKEELIEAMKLKPGELFKYSYFTRDVEMLVDKYGDLGYAFVDVNPKTTKDRENKTVAINYEITKGEKVYFGEMTILGNAKTRDNVIRRELSVHDAELYSGTRLTQSKKDIQRLGFFEEIQVIKDRDEDESTLLNLRVKVTEKPTGQLQAALGFTPNQGGSEQQLFFQGRYDEKNQSGKGWETNLSGRWNGGSNYDVETGFFDPRVNDSQWSAGVSAFYKNRVEQLLSDVDVQERRVGGSVSVGRKIIELIRATLKYRIERITQTSETFLLERFRQDGISSSAIFTVSRNDLNNRLDPSEGSTVSASQNFTGGPILRGDHQYMESLLSASYYLPLDFSDTYRTYFRFHGLLGHIYPMGSQPVPFFERYRLGGYNDLRGFDFWSVGPKFNVLQAPGGGTSRYNKGGDKKALFQWEYFIPLIPEAGIKALIFTDYGRVFNDDEGLVLTGYERDVGFGFRWITPIAPFRFEWAYPIVDGQPGDMNFIFYLGY